MYDERLEGSEEVSVLGRGAPGERDQHQTVRGYRMNDFELSPRQIMELRRARMLATKIDLLLDVFRTESGEQLEYPAIRDAALEQSGYHFSRTRWSLLKNGKAQVVPDKALRALAAIFGVDPQYLLEEGAELPPAVEVALEALRPTRRAEVRRVADQALSVVDPEAFQAIAKILDKSLTRRRRAQGHGETEKQ